MQRDACMLLVTCLSQRCFGIPDLFCKGNFDVAIADSSFQTSCARKVIVIIHVTSAGAVIFYVSYEINMAVLTWLTPQYAREDRPSNVAYFLRQCCVILTAVALIVFACLSPDWSQYKLYIAICEW